MKTILTENPILFLLLCTLLCVLLCTASYYIGVYFRAAREKKLEQSLARIKESHIYEMRLCKQSLSERTYQADRKKQINDALISYLASTTFDYQSEPRQTAKDILRLHAIVVAAELASCGKITDLISNQIKQMELTPEKLRGEDDANYALKLMISAAIKKTQVSS